LSGDHAHIGTGEGSFTLLQALLSGTTYHVRSFATNSEGTVYGADVEFTTDVQSIGLTGGTFGLTNGSVGISK
jgi:hypothetical protein